MNKHVSKRKYMTCLVALMLSLTVASSVMTTVAYADDAVNGQSTIVDDGNEISDDTSIDPTEETVDIETDDILQYDSNSWDGVTNFPDPDGHLRYYMDDLEDGKGSLTMKYVYNDSDAVSGAEISLYRIADITVHEGDAQYKTLEGYDSFEYAGVSVDALNNYAASQVEIAKQKAPDKTAVTDSEGKVVFDELDYGMYLVIETDRSGNATKYYNFAPFCINVPFPDIEETVYQGHWTYDVEVEPKTEIEKIPDSSTPDSTPTPPPQTGNDGIEKHNYAFIYGVASVIFALVTALAVIFIRRNDNDEEKE